MYKYKYLVVCDKYSLQIAKATELSIDCSASLFREKDRIR